MIEKRKLAAGAADTLYLITPKTVLLCENAGLARADSSPWLRPLAERPRYRSKYDPHQGVGECLRRAGLNPVVRL